jgi:hypothetical protein
MVVRGSGFAQSRPAARTTQGLAKGYNAIPAFNHDTPVPIHERQRMNSCAVRRLAPYVLRSNEWHDNFISAKDMAPSSVFATLNAFGSARKALRNAGGFPKDLSIGPPEAQSPANTATKIHSLRVLRFRKGQIGSKQIQPIAHEWLFRFFS